MDFILQNLNVGFDLTFNEYYQAIAKVIGFKGKFVHNLNAPTGMSHKLINIEKARSHG